MDSLIKRYDAVVNADLMLCEHHGVAYQKDIANRSMVYGEKYLEKVRGYEYTPISIAVNAGRVALLSRHLSPDARVLDYGVGSGAFMRAALAARFDMYGFEVIAEVREQLEADERFAESAGGFDAITLWDVLEHMDAPEMVLKRVTKGAHTFVSLPVFEDLRMIRESKHYRPGEHLYYWTAEGFVEWMGLRGFRLLETSTHETDAGRESIGAFAFVKDLPDYHDHVFAYRQMHESRHYGSSAADLHLDGIAAAVRKVKPTSIIDYGCGRSDLVAHFWNDGARKIARFDPAIPKLEMMPEGTFDLALCCDVMEHIPMASVDRVLVQLRKKSARCLFTISTKPAHAKLPDGRNAHVTLLRPSEWVEWLKSYYGKCEVIKTQWETELMVLASPARG